MPYRLATPQYFAGRLLRRLPGRIRKRLPAAGFEPANSTLGTLPKYEAVSAQTSADFFCGRPQSRLPELLQWEKKMDMHSVFAAHGAAGEGRTPDLRVTKPLLCQLSYSSIVWQTTKPSAGAIEKDKGKMSRIRFKQERALPHRL